MNFYKMCISKFMIKILECMMKIFWKMKNKVWEIVCGNEKTFQNNAKCLKIYQKVNF